jgi:hypothetical protein
VKNSRSIFTISFGLCLLAGCVGTFNYVRPLDSVTPVVSRTVGKSKEDVWRQITPALDGHVLAVDRLDKDAGVVTFSYRGDPERYVDCGWITSHVKNLRGERTYRFAAANASTEYELVTGKEILFIDRQMIMEGRLTVTVAAVSAGETQVSAHAHYVLTRTLMVRDTQGHTQTVSHLIDFGSGQEGAFPGLVTCRPTGHFERDALSALAH